MRARKQRTGKNGYIDIDSVTITPGIDFCNWIRLTKEKLKERETKLLMIKISEIESIVNKQLSTSTRPCIYKINRILMENNINTSIISVIDEWPGVHIDRIKKNLTKFRDYFVIGKNWWDIKKQKLIANHFWIKIFEDIDQVQTQPLIHYVYIEHFVVHIWLVFVFFAMVTVLISEIMGETTSSLYVPQYVPHVPYVP